MIEIWKNLIARSKFDAFVFMYLFHHLENWRQFDMVTIMTKFNSTWVFIFNLGLWPYEISLTLILVIFFKNILGIHDEFI